MNGPIPSSWSSRLLSVLRIVAGLLFMTHGTQKVFGVPAGAQPPFHPAPMSLPWFGGWIELVLGALILIGLFTHVAAFVCSGEMAVAYFKSHAPNGFWPILNKGELAVLYCFVFLYLAAAGAGPWSVDAGRVRRRL